MKKSFLKELLDRRIPQILGSYFVGATTLIFFIDWLVVKYGFSDYYTSLALFGLISILPSVVILAYFHGAPGKDEWTKVEKFGIPINILFIAIALFSGYRFNVWQEKPFDHSEINDTFLVHLSSPEDILNKMEKLSYYDEVKDYADEKNPLNSQMLNTIREYIYVNLKKEFMNHENVSIYYPEDKTEIDMLDDFASVYHLIYLQEEVDDKKIAKQRDEESDIIRDHTLNTYDYFNEKYNTNIDRIIIIDVMEAKLNDSGKRVMTIAQLDFFNNFEYVYGYEGYSTEVYVKDNGNRSFWCAGEGGGSITDEEGDGLKENLFESFSDIIKDYAFGEYIGEVNAILDPQLVTIKLEKEGLIKGTDLVVMSRDYLISKTNSIDINQNIREYIDDYILIYNYMDKNPDDIEKIYDSERSSLTVMSKNDSIRFSSVDNWLIDTKHRIDSLENNIDKIVEEFNPNKAEEWSLGSYMYYLRILNVQDGIATAKITGSVHPFSMPKIGDKVNIK
jgi:hypothetical protein